MRKKDVGYRKDKYCTLEVEKLPVGNADIDSLIAEMRERAKQCEQPPFHYEKGAAIYFTLDEIAYVIKPRTIDTSGEILGHLANEIIDKLYDLGAYDMFYGGMLD